MCDYSLHNVKSRPARVGDKLTTRNFNTGTRGFAAPEDANTAVCVLPGTELAFARAVCCQPRGSFGWKAGRRLRDAIEERASRKFLEGPVETKGPVVLRSNDFFK
jgi:hypothetical protein